MEDEKIIDLFFKRSEQAITESDRKYGRSCRKVSFNILQNREDVNECLNDTYLAAWNTIPPKRPNPLVAYLLRIIKNLSLKKYRDNCAQKRYSAMDTCFEELEECLPSAGSGTETANDLYLKIVIEQFLDHLDADSRLMFVRRYWYGDSVRNIARIFRISENNASVRLHRIRKELKDYMEKEGVSL